MIGQLPPFALATPRFRFKALASHAGRASLGGDREIALACFAIARLGAGLLPPVMLAAGDASARAGSVKHWLASITLAPAARSAASDAIEAIATGRHRASADALRTLGRVAAPHLDRQAVAEIDDLAADLQASLRTQVNSPKVG